jgi:hypothetical protein
MRKFASNYLSGRVRATSPSDVLSDRYTYLSLDQAEPNFGIPSNNITQLPGNQGTNSFLMTTGAGDRRIIAIGEDLELEEIGSSGDYKLGIAVGATTSTVSLAQAASSLDSTLQVGMVSDRPIELSNTQDVSDVEVESGSFVAGTVYKITQIGLENWEALDDNPVLVTGITYAQGTLFKANGAGSGAGTTGTSDRGKAIAVPSFSTDGGIELGETLQLQDEKRIVWHTTSTGVNNQIYADWNSAPISNGNQSKIDFIVGQGDFSGYSGLTQPTDDDALVLRLKENTQSPSGRQTATIQIGKAVDNESLNPSNTSQSSTIIRTNQTLILDPARVGNTANSGTVTINGNLEVLGTQTTVNSTTLTIADKNIQLADGATTSTQASLAGFTFGEYPSSLTGANTEFVSQSQHTASSNVPESRTPVNLTPQLIWETNSAPEHRFKANKKFESTGFLVTGATTGTDIGFIMSDGSVSTVEYEQVGSVTNSQYDLAVTAGTNTGSFQLQETGTANADTIDIAGTGGVSVNITAINPGVANAKITVDGGSISGTTYSLETSTNSSDVDLTIQGISGNTNSSDTVTFKGSNNINVSQSAVDELVIASSNSPSYNASGAFLDINNTSTSGALDAFDENDLALKAVSATAGSVAKFARSTQGDHANGGVLLLEINDQTTAAANPWISFMNVGSAKNDSTQSCMGEITTKQSEDTNGDTTIDNLSGIRIWGQRNIDFDVSNGAKPANALTERRISVTTDGLLLQSSSDIIHKGASFDTTVTFTAPTADRTITFPDETGTVALVGMGGGLITTVNASANADHYIVFAEDAVSTPGSNQDPLTNTSLKFNPSTGTLTATSKSFLIDHPTKDGMKLQYTCLEGPENGVYVRGRLKDDNVIELPDYWLGLVDENTITVNLTPIGHSQDLYVQDITDNQVIINDNENINCFYTVFAERKDIDKLVVEYEDV